MTCKKLILINIFTCINNIKKCVWYMIHLKILYVTKLIIILEIDFNGKKWYIVDNFYILIKK
jgi:uncharacterized membrane protein YjdF